MQIDAGGTYRAETKFSEETACSYYNLSDAQ